MSAHLASARIHGATIRITQEGCVDCRCTISPSWHEKEIVKVAIGPRRMNLALYRCQRCERNSRPGATRPPRERAQEGERADKPMLADGLAGTESGE